MTDLVLRQAGAALRGLRGADTVWLLVLAVPLAVAALDPTHAGDVLSTAVGALAGTLPYILIAVCLIGVLKAAGAEGVLAKAFEGNETKAIVLAAAVGGLAPFCSCEVIPFVAALLAAGTPVSAVMAFWLASPLMDPSQFAITTGALGVEYAAGKVIFAVLIGISGGMIMKTAMAAGAFSDPLRAAAPTSCCSAKSTCGTGKLQRPVWRFWEEAPRRAEFRDAALNNFVFLLKWMSLAYLIEGLMIHYVPAEAIAAVVGGEGVVPVILGALVGMPAYLNGYAAPALVSGLMEQGMTPGAAMAFMIAGGVSCIPAMAAVWALVRHSVFAMYVVLGLTGAVTAGLIFDIAVKGL